jgi:hypothetical protein
MFLLQILCLFGRKRQSCRAGTELRLSKKSFDDLFSFREMIMLFKTKYRFVEYVAEKYLFFLIFEAT